MNSPLSVSVTNLSLVAGAPAQAVSISESGYSRLFTLSTSDAAVAAIGATVVAGPFATITIAARNPGVAIVRVADDHGGMRTISISVRAAAPATHPPGRQRSP
jgi:hypothetical protein